MTGFESIGKASEEASSEFQSRRFLLAIMLAMLVGIGFYVMRHRGHCVCRSVAEPGA